MCEGEGKASRARESHREQLWTVVYWYAEKAKIAVLQKKQKWQGSDPQRQVIGLAVAEMSGILPPDDGEVR